MGFLSGVHAWWRSIRFQPSQTKTFRILVDAEGLFVSEDGVIRDAVAWRSIATIYAYKKDCFSFDQIQLEIFCDGSEVSVVITEEYEGFSHLQEALTLRLGVPIEWYVTLVAAPAFELSLTRIYPVAQV